MTDQLTPPAPYPGAPPPTAQPGDRTRFRGRLYLAGLVPLALVLLLALKVALMYDHDSSGREAFAEEGYGGAATEFAANGSFNVLEGWIAPFGEGTSLLAAEEYDDAVARLEDALDRAPDDQRCTVAINLALAHEAQGDAAQGDQDVDTATQEWQAGLDLLEAEDCPSDSGQGEEQSATAGTVAERLEDKLDTDEDDEQQEQSEEEKQKPPPPDEKKEKELEKRMKQGAEDRRDQQEYDEYGGSTGDAGPQW